MMRTTPEGETIDTSITTYAGAIAIAAILLLVAIRVGVVKVK